MSGMIERVARALFEQDQAAASQQFPDAAAALGWDGPNFKGHDLWRAKARAAIEAMRTPTSVMLEPKAVSRNEKRLDGTYPVNYLVVALDIWPQMIDAALKK